MTKDEFEDIETKLQELYDLCIKLESDRINELEKFPQYIFWTPIELLSFCGY